MKKIELKDINPDSFYILLWTRGRRRKRILFDENAIVNVFKADGSGDTGLVCVPSIRLIDMKI